MANQFPKPDPTLIPEASLKVCLLAGNNQSRHFGVKEYAYGLAKALVERGIEAQVEARRTGEFVRSSSYATGCAARLDVLHVQFYSGDSDCEECATGAL